MNFKIYSIGQQGTESVGCGNANESHCKTLFGLPAQYTAAPEKDRKNNGEV